MHMSSDVLVGDVMDRLRELPSESIQCCVTSPPYWNLRDYGIDGQIGREPTIAEYVAKMVAVFEEVRRVLAKDGTLWLNLGDSYSQSGGWSREDGYDTKQATNSGSIRQESRKASDGLKPKDICGIPWRVAFALQDVGWYLRSDIIWHKPNCMPESVTDRPTTAHEHIFLLTKSAKYWYDAEAISEPAKSGGDLGLLRTSATSSGDGVAWHAQSILDRKTLKATMRESGTGMYRPNRSDIGGVGSATDTRNARTVWTIPSQPYIGAHFATFPEEIPRRCILAGCPEDGTVLDPFCGSGTTGAVCVQLQRNFIGIELNPEYVLLARRRIAAAVPKLFDIPRTRRVG